MLTISDNEKVLRNRIKEDLDILDMDELKKLYKTIANIAAEKAIKLADRDWEGNRISRGKIKEEVRNYRQSRK